MVIDDLDIPRFALPPRKADPPLVVDANAHLPRTIAFQRLQAIAGRHAQIVKSVRRVKHLQLGSCPPADLRIKSFDPVACEQRGSPFVGKTLDHEQTYRNAVRSSRMRALEYQVRQHFLNFLPLPQGHGSFRPTFAARR
jgi:hypothetical protein